MYLGLSKAAGFVTGSGTKLAAFGTNIVHYVMAMSSLQSFWLDVLLRSDAAADCRCSAVLWMVVQLLDGVYYKK